MELYGYFVDRKLQKRELIENRNFKWLFKFKGIK